MKIRLLSNYGGTKTNERRIPPGDYDAQDPVLMSLAQYLVECLEALVIEADADPEPITDDQPPKPKRSR